MTIKHGTVFISDSGGIYYYDENTPGNKTISSSILLTHLFMGGISSVNPDSMKFHTQLDSYQSMRVLSNYGKWKKNEGNFLSHQGEALIDISNDIDCIVDPSEK